MVDLGPGSTVAGWRIERELARGGMGVLFLARHPRLPRVDVLKVLPVWLAEDQRFRERFLREASRVSGLSHPHIVVVHDSGEHEGLLWLAMQYVRGGDLRGQLAAGPLPVGRALALCAQVASALDAAHRAGIVHRDVKPENVLLAETGPDEPDHVLLTDFGISRDEAQVSTLTSTGELLLTPAYAAPEQVAAEPVDGRADQYALACMLFELLTGRPPYANGSPLAMLAAHLHQPVRSLPPTRSWPPGLEAALRRAMAKSRAERFGSCRAFLDAARADRSEHGSPGAVAPIPAQEAGTEVLPSVRLGTAAAGAGLPTGARPPAPIGPWAGSTSSAPDAPESPAREPSAPVPVPSPSGAGGSWPPVTQNLRPAGPRPAPRPRRGRVVAAAMGAVLVAGAVGVAAHALVGGSSGNTPATVSGSAGATGAATYDQLLARIPASVRADCRDATGDLNAQQQPYVGVRAGCTTRLGGTTVDVLYDGVRGDASVATTYRRSVLGIGGVNHAPGNCLTRERDPATADRPAHRGLYMPAGTTALDVESWCDFAGPVYLLQPDPAGAIFVSVSLEGDDGDVSRQQERYDDLLALRPS